jgi:hypothetical protein
MARNTFAFIVRQRQEAGLARPDIDHDDAARQMLAVWDGLQVKWLTALDFDLADKVNQAFRRLTGQPTMEARHMLDRVLSQI